jgi:hypothetical protein
MYDEERSRVRHAGSVEELRQIMAGIQIRNVPFLGPFEDGIDPEPELTLLKTINNRLRRLVDVGKIHRK